MGLFDKFATPDVNEEKARLEALVVLINEDDNDDDEDEKEE